MDIRIPKVIHYCWFGRGKLPKLAKKCIKSWKKYLPDYKIIEWNEDNFDINSNQYVREAYEAKKYAFVSDYVRLYALYNYGGIYMDTDVEVIKSLDEFLIHEAFSGFESPKDIHDRACRIWPHAGHQELLNVLQRVWQRHGRDFYFCLHHDHRGQRVRHLSLIHI